MVGGLVAAIRFLTVLPVPGPPSTERDLAGALTWFPLVGLLLGLLVATADALYGAVLPAGVASALSLALLAALTAGLHLDGLADTFDGLFHPGGAQRRLEVMRDSRSGPHGVAALALVLLVQWSALSALVGPDRWAALAFTPCLARWAVVLAVAAVPYGRSEGKGAAFQAPGRRWRAGAATAFTAATGAALLGAGALLPGAAALLVTAGFCAVVLRQLPGMTGDTYGALAELVQAAGLAALAIP